MDGLLIIDKAAGMTSHDVVNRVRRILGTRRVGHTGTLDPFATGVMVILVGQATRLAQFLDKDSKEYEALLKFGAETDTGDKTGTVTAELELSDADLAAQVEELDWELVFSQFRGDIMQVPPMYSAKKIDGKKLYELARKGETVERKAVPVTIYDLGFASNSSAVPAGLCIRVKCSAGTYIRTLSEDIARAAGLLAHLTELRRISAGPFDLSGAVTLEELSAMDDPAEALTPMESALKDLPTFLLNSERAAKTKNGLSSRTTSDHADGEMVRMVDEQGSLVAIGRFDKSEKTVQPKVVFG